MEKDEFIRFIEGLKPYMKQVCKPLDIKSISKDMYNRYNGKFDFTKLNLMLNVFSQVGTTTFFRNEIKSSDELLIDMHWALATCIWSDLNILTNRVGVIRNCTGVIEEIYISESGKYYNHLHNQIADTNEALFDYLAYNEYDYHPVIENQIYDVLRSGGWYENRCTDISLAFRYMSEKGIILTEKQLKVISEFNDLSFATELGYFEFYSINDLFERDLEFIETAEWHNEIIGYNVLEIGQSHFGTICVDSDGILLNSGSFPIGRTLIECIRHLVHSIYPR